jgi:hypothetical protein
MAFSLVFRRYAPFEVFGFGFEGDNRSGPSVSLSSTARTIGIVEFIRGDIVSFRSFSSGTRFLGSTTAVLVSPVGTIFEMARGQKFSNVTKTLTRMVTPDSIGLSASTAGANPLVPGAPDIDTFVDFNVQWIGSNLVMQGRVRGDDFPNAEVFVLDSAGTACLLFDGRTTKDKDAGPMTELAGSHETQILGAYFAAMNLTSGGDFTAARTSCPVTTW